MQPSKIRESVPASSRPLVHPAVRLVFEVSLLLALWVALWALVWGGVLRPLAQAAEAIRSDEASIQAEASR
jgi:hypothetical protein